MAAKTTPIRDFLKHNYRHFNAAVVVDAAEAWVEQLRKGNKMFLSMAGAMSTAELGLTLAEMIRQDKVHAISTTGANLEEDIYNLTAHDSYRRIPNYRHLTAQDELDLRKEGLNRVTDTCIPEERAIRRIEKILFEIWREAEKSNERYFPYEVMYKAIRSGKLKPHYEIDPKCSWVVAACEKDIPIYTPGWEDSTTGNIVVAHFLAEEIKSMNFMKTGLEQMAHLAKWYRDNSKRKGIGFFQIAGGIAGDFPICVVPMLRQDLHEDVPHWSYFCQISDSTTSYGSYSGAVPNEKITWDKLGPETPKFIIESDATIVAPLVFQYVLESTI